MIYLHGEYPVLNDDSDTVPGAYKWEVPGIGITGKSSSLASSQATASIAKSIILRNTRGASQSESSHSC